MTGYCVAEDVRKALQERNLSGPLDSEYVEPAIEAVSVWLRKRTRGHWFDSAGAVGTSIPTTVRNTSDTDTASAPQASDVFLDVPSSPHPTDRQIRIAKQGVRYPVTHAGPYARMTLPHRYVQSITKLEVRDRGGGVTDWIAASDKAAGRGEDYYLRPAGADMRGRTYLFVRASSIGARTDYGDLLTVAYDYGLDKQQTDWQDVRRGVALATAAQLVTDDDVLTAIPDNGQLIGVDTQRQQLVDDAADLLDPYMPPPRS